MATLATRSTFFTGAVLAFATAGATFAACQFVATWATCSTATFVAAAGAARTTRTRFARELLFELRAMSMEVSGRAKRALFAAEATAVEAFTVAEAGNVEE